MNNCCDTVLISTIACQIAECLDDDSLAVLSADLVMLGDILANIAVKRDICNKSCDNCAK